MNRFIATGTILPGGRWLMEESDNLWRGDPSGGGGGARPGKAA